MTFNEFLETVENAEEREQWEQLGAIARAYFVNIECCNSTLDPVDVEKRAHAAFMGILPRTGNDDADIATLLLDILGGVESLDRETLEEFFDLKRWGREQGYYYDIAEEEHNGRQERYLFRL